MKTQIFNSWNFLGLMRLALGIAITAQSIYAHQSAMVAIGILLTGMAVLNIGCCGAKYLQGHPGTTKDKAMKQ